MPSLKALRNRIASVKATQKITKAMQMVAAAKLRRAQEQAEAARPYAERMAAVLANVAQAVKGGAEAPPLMTGTGSEQRHLLIVCTADRGLAGSFNAAIVRKAADDARRLLNEGKTVQFFCVGRKGYDMLRRTQRERIVQTISFRDVRQIGFEQARQVGTRVIEMFNNNDFDVATVYYSRFRSVISQEPTALRVIPASFPEDRPEEEGSAGGASYDYEPSEEAILADLVPRNISIQIFRALLENAASEQGARMSAMDNATRNAGEMIGDLTLDYNRTRQAQITKELIEIISGAEAV